MFNTATSRIEFGAPQTIGAGAVTTLALTAPSLVVCREGVIWLTSEARPGDHLLEMGDRLHLQAGEKVILQGLQPSAFVVFSHPAVAAAPDEPEVRLAVVS